MVVINSDKCKLKDIYLKIGTAVTFIVNYHVGCLKIDGNGNKKQNGKNIDQPSFCSSKLQRN